MIANPPPDAFLAAVQALPPPGRAFPRDPDTLMAQVFVPPANALAAVRATALDLVNAEADPAQTLQLLAEWEADYGLPDPCTTAGATLDQRRAALLAKIAAVGGQSIAYFTAVATALGYAITITEYNPATPSGGSPSLDAPMNYGWRFAWTVNVPAILVHRAAPGISTAEDPLWIIDETELPCRLAAIKPARTVLLFNFG